MNDSLAIAGKVFNSRLFTGTGKFGNHKLMEEALLASGSELVTVALKRVNLDGEDDDILSYLNHPHISLLPNTSGVRNAEEAVFAARLAREALQTNWLKLEIHPDPKYLMPDPIETLKAAEVLVKEGFIVLPYIHADPVLCKRLESVGVAAVMPLGSPNHCSDNAAQKPCQAGVFQNPSPGKFIILNWPSLSASNKPVMPWLTSAWSSKGSKTSTGCMLMSPCTRDGPEGCKSQS